MYMCICANILFIMCIYISLTCHCTEVIQQCAMTFSQSCHDSNTSSHSLFCHDSFLSVLCLAHILSRSLAPSPSCFRAFVLSRSLTLSLSCALALSLSRPLALSLSRFLALSLSRWLFLRLSLSLWFLFSLFL